MSNHWKFTCLSHNPFIVSEDICSHTGNLDYDYHIELAKSRPLDMNMDDVNERNFYGNYYERNVLIFLIQHEKCEIGLIDEYGVQKTLDGEDLVEGNDKPDWYKITPRGIAIIQCVVCIRLNLTEVEQASTIFNGRALCYKHINH